MRRGDHLILITGITGQQGGAVARELLADGHRLRGMTRNPQSESAREFADRGAEIVRGDLNDRGSLERAVDGAWGVLSIQNTWEAGVEVEEEQGIRLAEVARKAGVQHFVYHSVGSADRDTGIPHFDNKWRIEEKVRELDFPSFTIIRPVFFMENLTSPWFKPSIDDGKLAIALQPETRLQMIAVQDIGKYSALAFEEHEKLDGQAIDIAGDELTMPEAARVLTRATGRDIEFVQVSIEEVRKSSEDFAIMLEWFDREGYDADIEGDAKKFEIEPTRFEDWAVRQNWG